MAERLPNNRIPKLKVVQGNRPDGDLSSMRISLADPYIPAFWAERDNSITFGSFDGLLKWRCNPGDAVIWQASGLTADALGNLTVSVHSSQLQAGDYQLGVDIEDDASSSQDFTFRTLQAR